MCLCILVDSNTSDSSKTVLFSVEILLLISFLTGDSLMGMTLVDVEWIEIKTNESEDASNCLMASREARGVLEEDCSNVHRAACSYTAPGEITSLSSV